MDSFKTPMSSAPREAPPDSAFSTGSSQQSHSQTRQTPSRVLLKGESPRSFILDYLRHCPDEAMLETAYREAEARGDEEDLDASNARAVIPSVLCLARELLYERSLTDEEREAAETMHRGCHIIRTMSHIMKVSQIQLLNALTFYHHVHRYAPILKLAYSRSDLPAVTIASLLVAAKSVDVAGKLEKALDFMRSVWSEEAWGNFPDRATVLKWEFDVLKSLKFDTGVEPAVNWVEWASNKAQVPQEIRACVYQFFHTEEYQDSSLCLVQDPLAVICLLIAYVVERRNLKLRKKEGYWRIPLDLPAKLGVDVESASGVWSIFADSIVERMLLNSETPSVIK